jgi:hypothetical protein
VKKKSDFLVVNVARKIKNMHFDASVIGIFVQLGRERSTLNLGDICGVLDLQQPKRF